MKKILSLFTFMGLGCLYTGCSSVQKIELMKPEPEEAAPITYPINTSYLNFPITLSVQDIENQTNKALQGLLYEDNNINDDNIEVQVWKNGEIKITENKEKLQTIVPLKIWARVRYGTSALGLNLYDTREFNLNGAVTLLSDVKLNHWKINTLTLLQDIKWQESPTITLMGKPVAITYLINPAIKLFKSKIERLIDQSMDKTLDFKENILQVMQKISTPIQMSSVYQTWLKINPQELCASNAIIQKNAVSMTVGLKCLMQSYIGQQPAATFDKDKIVLKNTNNIPEKVTANITAISTYKDASNIMTANFRGQVFNVGNRKIAVQNVEIWHKRGKMVIALDMTGSINGRIYLCGVPQYNAVTKELYFQDLDYALETKSKLLKTANWLMQGVILSKIKENCKYSILPNLEEGKKNIIHYLSNYSPMPGVFINGKLNTIELEKIQLTTTEIVAFLSIGATVKISVNGMH